MTGFPVVVREIVQQRATVDGVKRCEKCGEYASDLQYHHRRPRGMGGSKRVDTNVASACLLLCGMCHLWVESYRAEALNAGWLVRQTKVPQDTPVVYRGVPSLLDDLGGVTPTEQAA